MRRFLVQIPMREPSRTEVGRARRTIRAAATRLGRTTGEDPPVLLRIGPEDADLRCLVEATSAESVRRLLVLALLPRARIRELTGLAAALAVREARTRSSGDREPGGDLPPRVETELVEDVVDVRLDGAFGEE